MQISLKVGWCSSRNECRAQLRVERRKRDARCCNRTGLYVSGTTNRAIIPKNAAGISVIHAVQRQPRCESVMNPPLGESQYD